MKKIILLLFALPSILLTSCGDFKEVTFIGIENIKINKVSQQGIDIDVTAKIKNPNKSKTLKAHNNPHCIKNNNIIISCIRYFP